jgi:hypothetical protein
MQPTKSIARKQAAGVTPDGDTTASVAVDVTFRSKPDRSMEFSLVLQLSKFEI